MMQVRVNSGLDSSGINGRIEKWLDSRYISKVESTEFADGLDMQESVGCEQLEKYT